MEKIKCCICGKEFEGYGNNPWGAACLDENRKPKELEFKDDDRCCDECNTLYVIPGRLYRMQKNK